MSDAVSQEMRGPKRIWLQDAESASATWCADRIDDADVEYVRADLLSAAVAEAREECAKIVEDNDCACAMQCQCPALVAKIRAVAADPGAAGEEGR